MFAVEQYVKINLEVEPIKKRVKKLNSELVNKEYELEQLKKNYLKNLENLNQLNQKFLLMEKSY